MQTGGEIGIRTLGTVAGTPHFECGAFDHSAISPRAWNAQGTPRWSLRSARLADGRALAKGRLHPAATDPNYTS
jgi:hypothetical protein